MESEEIRAYKSTLEVLKVLDKYKLEYKSVKRIFGIILNPLTIERALIKQGT